MNTRYGFTLQKRYPSTKVKFENFGFGIELLAFLSYKFRPLFTSFFYRSLNVIYEECKKISLFRFL